MFIFSIFLLSFLTLVILNKDVFKKKVIYSKLQTYILNILFIGILLSCLIVLFIYSLNAFYIDGPKLEIFYTGIMILPSLLGMIFIISLVSLIYINRRYLFKNDRGE